MLSVAEVGIAVIGVLTAVVYGTAGVASADTTAVFVYPETSYVLIGDTFEVALEVDSNAVELKGFDILLGFDSEKLKLLDVIEGPLMKEGGTTFWYWEEDSSRVEMVCAILGTGLSVDGPGVLAMIWFEVSQAENSRLRFQDVDLRDVDNSPIPYQLRDGVVCASEIEIWEEVYTTDWNSMRIGLGAVPNPCTHRTCLRYQIPRDGTVLLAIYDGVGRVVRRLINEPRPAGMHEIHWAGRTDEGTEVASGVYFAVLHVWSGCRMYQKVSEKVVLVK